MKILKIAPIYIPLNPDLKYGGIERVVLALSRCFSEKGHEVLIAAPADSDLSNNEEHDYGAILPTLDKSEWSKPRLAPSDPDAYETHVEITIEHIEKNRPDIIHDHTGNFVLSNSFRERAQDSKVLQETPIVTTPHEFQRFKKLRPPKQKNIHFTALSEYQKNVFSRYVDVEEVINNGVFIEEFPFQGIKQNFMFSLGSVEEDKGQDLATRVAFESGLALKIAGPIPNQRFYDLEIRPFTKRGFIDYIGPLDDKTKKGLYSNAMVSISPIRIGDCFSLVRVEPLACGTPVVTLDTGSAREAVIEGLTGYLIPYENLDDDLAVNRMVEAIKKIQGGEINPADCRKDVVKRFNWRDISDKYISLYQRIQDGLK